MLRHSPSFYLHSNLRKGKTPKKKPRITITAVLLDIQENVPKDNARKMLKVNECVKFGRLLVFKCDNHEAVDTKIHNVFGIEQYLFLECVKGGNKLSAPINR